MGKERQITCDCGGIFKEVRDTFEGVEASAMRCAKCGHTMFSSKQADEYIRLRDLKQKTDKERKVIRIGNSKGITIPEFLKVKVGQKAKIEILSTNSFKVTVKG